MILKDSILPRTHKLYLISDPHYGTILQHKSGIKKMKKMILEESNSYVAFLGDLCEAIMIDDPRYCPDTIDPNSPRPLAQYQEAIKDFWELRERLLVVLDGNHDWKVTAKYGNLLKDVFCKELEEGVRDIYGTYSCKLAVRSKDGDLMYKAFLTHGNGSISSVADDPVRREANYQLALKRKLYPLAGDCVIQAMGHSHKLIVKPPIKEMYVTDDGSKLKHGYTSATQTQDFIPPDLRWYVNTGCFYKLYELGVSGYAERAMYKPNELGFAVVHVKNGIIKEVERILI